jgi:hypothetical protein
MTAGILTLTVSKPPSISLTMVKLLSAFSTYVRFYQKSLSQICLARIYLGRKSSLWPIQESGSHLSCLVAVIIDGLQNFADFNR